MENKMLRPGDFIKCHDTEDVKTYLRALNDEGYHAVVADASGLWIRITAAPEKEGRRKEKEHEGGTGNHGNESDHR